MDIKLYQVDAFTDRVFGGNPAAVCPLGAWPEDGLLQAIADENNLSETAFFVPEGAGFRLRWFTPEAEVDLCGHATLATAHVIFAHLNYPEQEICFYTRSGELRVQRHDQGYCMDFPASMPETVEPPQALMQGLGVAPKAVYAAYDYVVVLESEAAVRAVTPDFAMLCELDGRGVLITAPGDHCDFVSRCFFPKLRVNEDPVTGSAHCELAPLWADQLQKQQLQAKQLSRRGGALGCEVTPGVGSAQRVKLIGQAADFCEGMISVPDEIVF
ncbi:PhzF family phenazine biosynthesis protein [Aliidiomarina halalkaliphila]|uniref:PhzF family phenazine biosynthesis protein n=1 Tax=Aliidiomarina halalkaliphila TaxID=2593535 RepID=A0A552X3B8_9GAMM|nr:PhzF family phenazine biosynthesis protein [Aliidiomarina halalkaliphila]TRW49534.1 PhzF family phenazine biosynthesis protein [Aliidiomarina halalkaliphila]